MNMVQEKNWWKRIEEEMRRVHRCRMKAVLTLWGIGLLLGLGGCAEQTQDAAGEESRTTEQIPQSTEQMPQDSGQTGAETEQMAPGSGQTGTGTEQAVQSSEGTGVETDGAEDTMEAVLEQALPSVVQIYHGTPEGGHTAGSGFIMEMTDDTVYLCTNRHVIAKYDDWDVYFYDGTCVTGSKAGTDDVYDVGVVAVDRTAIPKEVQEKLKTVSYDLSSWEELGNAELPVGIVRIGQEGNVLHTLTGSLLRKETEFLWGQGEKETEVRMAITDGDSGSAVFDENGKHHEKHIHIKYNEYEAVYNIEGKLLEGILPKKQKKLVEAWIYIHQEELESLWNLMQEQGEFFKIEPLK